VFGFKVMEQLGLKEPLLPQGNMGVIDTIVEGTKVKNNI